MSDHADASRYARELFDITWRHKQAETVADELDSIVGIARDHGDDVRPLFHPLIPRAHKVETIRRLSAALSLSRPTTVLLSALAQASRLPLISDVARHFRDRLNHKRGIVQATVTTAAALSPEKARALAQRLEGLVGRQVLLTTVVDPSIIGGVVTQIDSTVYDGSVTRQLARMRAKLVENV